MKIVVCMLFSNHRRISVPAMQSIINNIPMDHMVISVADFAREHFPQVEAVIPQGLKPEILPGCNHRLTMAHHRFRQFDVALNWLSAHGQSDGWIINVDDDDLILGMPQLSDAPGRVGLFHSDVLAVCTVDSGPYRKAGDCFVRTSKEITEPKDGRFFKGSFWGVRMAAWKQLAPIVDRVTVFEEWAMAYQAIKLGWKDWYIPQVLQTQRLRNYHEAAAAQQATGNTWETYVKQLENGRL